jgi:hypothetical protein
VPICAKELVSYTRTVEWNWGAESMNPSIKLTLGLLCLAAALPVFAQEAEESYQPKRVLIFNHLAPADRPELIIYEKLPEVVSEAPILISSLKSISNDVAGPSDAQAAAEQAPLNSELKAKNGTMDKAKSPSIKPPKEKKATPPAQVEEDHSKDGSDPVFDQNGEDEENEGNYMEESFSTQKEKSE